MTTPGVFSCHLGPGISAEHVVREHFFVWVMKGEMQIYDGSRTLRLPAGRGCLFLKNHLVRYTKTPGEGGFLKVVVVLDEGFLRSFDHQSGPPKGAFPGGVVEVAPFVELEAYLQGLGDRPSTDRERWDDQMRRRFLALLLAHHPELSDALFRFGPPQKINLEEFMNRSFRFRVPLGEFARLSGRSLSTFKREFPQLLGDTPGRWLTRRRLEEAYFLLSTQGKTVGEAGLLVGFENLSHFSHSFRKRFGVAPSKAGGVRSLGEGRQPPRT